MNKKMKLFAFAAVVACLLFAIPEQANATVYGCTPGYWKNHTEAWVGYTPTQTVGSVFNIPGALGGAGGAIGSATLLDALQFGGGPTVEDAAKILLRAAVASLLNSAHPVLGWGGAGYTSAFVIATTNLALSTLDRVYILTIATGWDNANNNNLACPLN